MQSINVRSLGLRLLLGAGLLLSTVLSAATFDILVDEDNNIATGCTVATPAGPFAGVEFIVTTTVNTSVFPPMVSGVSRRNCVTPPSTFSAPLVIDAGGWPIGIGNGTAGYDVLETYFPVSFAFGQYRLGFVYTDPNAGSDAVITTNGQPGGAAILFALGPFPIIPTLAHGTLLLLAFALAWIALRRLRQYKVSTLVICGVLATIVAGTTWAAIILDGLIGDWAGVPALATDPTGDAPSGADLSAIFVKLENSKIFVRADVKTANPPSFTSANATTFTVGTAGNFAITTFGIPPVNNITQGGALPGGVNFVYTAGQSTASLTGTPNAGTGGIYPLTFGASNGVPPPGSQNFTLTVNQAPAIISPNNTAFIVGTPGTFTFVSTGFPAATLTLTGCVPALPGGLTFTDLGTGSATLTGSAALGSVGVKNCTLTATNGVGAPATQPFALTINKAPTTTTVVSSVNPSVIGQSVTFTATVVATPPGTGTPTGNVQFMDGANPIGGLITLSAGSASLSTAALTLGAHTITVNYLGDVDFVISTGSLPTQTVNKAATSTAVVSSVNPSVFGQPVTFTATVSATLPGSGTPSGTVTFSIDGVPQVPPVGLNPSGVATLTTAALSAGAHGITAGYNGDPNFSTSTGSLPTQTVNKANTTTTLALTSGTTPSVYGQSLTFTATVAAVAPGAGTPGGNVTFKDGITPICSAVLLAGGTAICATTTLSVNAHMMSADYSGDANFNLGTSNTLAQTVNKADTTTTIANAAALLGTPTVVGEPYAVNWSVTVNPPGTAATPLTGNVTVVDGTGATCSAAVAAGTCNLTSTTPGAPKTLIATYAGDGNYNGSASAGAPHTVTKANTTTTITNAASLGATATVIGEPYAVNVSVVPVAPGAGTPTGTVSVSEGLDTCTITLPATSCNLTSTTAGSKLITALYNADTNFNGSAAAPATHTVNKPATTTVITNAAALLATASVVGEPYAVNWSVTVNPPGVLGAPLTGTVTVSDGVAVCSAAVSAGTCNLTSTSPGAPKTITATYAGDANYNGSASPGVPHTVNKANTITTITNAAALAATPTVVGQAYTVTASTAAVAPGAGTLTGTITVSDGVATCPIILPAPSCNLTSTSPGAPKTITATYSGDTNFNASNGGASHTVNQAATTTSLVSDINPSTFGATVTFTATVTPVAPGAGTLAGTVSFFDNALPLGAPVGVVAGAAAVSTSTLSPGTHTITATYSGDANFTGSAGGPVTQTVNQAPLAVDDPNYIVLTGTTLTVTAGGTPDGLLANDTLGFPAATITTFGGGSVSLLVTDNPVGTPVMFGPGHVLNVSANGSFTFTAAAGSYGLVTFLYRLTNANGTSDATVTIGVQKAPLFTSANNTAFTPGSPGTFTVTTSGFPAPSIVVTSPFTPAAPWLTFTDNGNGTATLSGTPPLLATGSITFTMTAHNIIAPDATQNFTLNLQTPPQITSANNLTCVVGTPCPAFTVTATGVPTPTLSELGALPANVTFTPGTGVLGGTPLAGTGGVYSISFKAANGVLPDFTQPFTLTINEAPATPTGPTPVTFIVGTLATFNYAAATGFPAPTFTLTGCPTLPAAITLSAAGALSGTAPAGSGGDYNCTVQATNGIGAPGTLAIVVRIREAPLITSANNITFQTLVAGTFTVTTTGFPTGASMAITETGALPAPVTFVNNNNGTATLSGTPNTGTGGIYPITITANNGIAPNATQSFTLTVNQPPAITSVASAVFTEGVAGTFTVTTTGFPTNAAMVITESGALPAPVTFVNNNNGTATLGGTPNPGTAGLYPLTIGANNGVAPPASQPFSLRVCAVLTLSSLPQPTRTNTYTPSVTASGGTSPYTFAITAGSLAGTTLSSAGVFSGTVTAAGAYSFTITATDVNGCTGAQTYSGTINEPPVAGADAYQAVGNTLFVVHPSTDSGTGPHLYLANAGLLANDNNGNGGGPGVGITAAAGTFATTNAGSITIASDGTFSYVPPVSFTGADSYVYTISDGIGTGTGTVTLNVSTKIWYVKNDVALTGNGSSGSPFKTLAETVTPSAINDTIYIFTGDGTTTGQNAGIVLENGQRLIGQGAALTALGTFNAVLNPTLNPAGSAPTIGNSGGNGITLASNNTIRGLTVGDTPGFAKIFGTAFGTLTVGNTITPDVALTGTGKALDLTTGNFAVTSAFSAVASTSSATQGLSLVSVGGTVALGSTTVSGSTTQGISVISSAVNINFGNTSVSGSGGTGVNLGGAGTGNSGTLTFADLDISPAAGQRGLLATENTGTITTTSGTITTTTNNAVQIVGVSTASRTPLAMVLDSVSSAGGVNNVLLTNVSGSLAMNAGALSASTGAGFNVSGSNATISFAGSITNSTFGISLTNNTGGTINFSGAIALTTGANAAFTATGGGTVSATQNNTTVVNTLTTTTGTALNVANTTIGASGLTFRSITSVGGTTPGIVLNTTGGSGGLTVTGNGGSCTSAATCTGGSISGKTGTSETTGTPGVRLISTTNFRLTRMNISGNNHSGIYHGTVSAGGVIGSETINGFQLETCHITGNGDQIVSNPDEGGVVLYNLIGTAIGGANPTSINNTTIQNSAEVEVLITNISGTLTDFQMNNDTISSNNNNTLNPHGDLVSFLNRGAVGVNMTLNVVGGTFTGFTGNDNPNQLGTTANGIFADTSGGSMNAIVTGATFDHNNVGVGVSTAGTGTLIFDVHDNPAITQSRSIALNLFVAADATGTVNGKFRNNVVGTLGAAQSGSDVGFGIRVQNEGPAGANPVNVLVSGNTVQEFQNTSAINVNHGLPAAASSKTTNVTITGNTIRNITSGVGTGNLRAIIIQQNNTTAPGIVCADISGNTLTNIEGNTGDGTRIRLRQLAGGTVNVHQTDVNNLAAVNGSTAAQMSLSGTITFNQPTCPQPP
jgi:large repetitive protein